MSPLALDRSVYHDKILGCWMGKSAGGTLGTPLEAMWGRREPFNIDYYPIVREGGLPNDDLELQLIWLIALEERGLDLTCRDLAEYWLDYVRYNMDEYGLHKVNLRQGLCPPLSGWYNNHFRDCMGCPIRSEIWACIAPGLPDVAADYAWHDAVVDHAMGESVYGEMFNAALQSAAFFIADRDRLLDIGLSVIPRDCLTAQAIVQARRAHAQGLGWLDARNTVMELAYHANGQHSPINLGFQTIGWLYGRDFGDALCKAVNCGWDTDCTAATLGATLGIIYGAEALPERWMAPLGRTIATSESNGGIRSGPLARTVDELTERTIVIGEQLLVRHRGRVMLVERGGGDTAPVTSIEIDFGRIERIRQRRQDGALYQLPALDVLMGYPGQPVIGVNRALALEVELYNRCATPLRVEYALELPERFVGQGTEDGWITLEERGTCRLAFEISALQAEAIQTTNCGWLKLRIQDRSLAEAIPIVMIGAKRWLVSRPLVGHTLEDADEMGEELSLEGPSPDWLAVSFIGNELDVEPYFGGQPGVVYLQHFMRSPATRRVRLGVPNNWRMRLWVNGAEVLSTKKIVPLRPNLTGEESNYVDLDLERGWNHALIKLERGNEPIEAHFTVACDPPLWHGMAELEQTRLPWETPDFDPACSHYLAPAAPLVRK